MNGKSIATVHRWHLLDADKQVVGRFASRIAGLIMGKHKPTYSPHLEHGDNVVVVNASKLVFTGRKFSDKRYYWHSGWAGGLKSISPQELERKKQIERVLTHAVSGMLPNNGLRQKRMLRLRVFENEDFAHLAQFPELARQLKLKKEKAALAAEAAIPSAAVPPVVAGGKPSTTPSAATTATIVASQTKPLNKKPPTKAT